MALSPDQAAQTLELLADELDRRRRGESRNPGITELDNAYRGKYPLRFASQNFREYFESRYDNLTDNWCQIVAEAPHERLEVTGIRLPGTRDGDDELWSQWRRTDSDALSDLAFLDAIVCRRAFALVWGDRDGTPLVTWEHPSQAIVGYDPETRRRQAGAKVWCDETHDYATLYTADEVWKFRRDRMLTPRPEDAVATAPTLAGGWDLRAEGMIPNPLGKVPLVEFPNRPRLLGEPHSDIAGTLSMQNAVNLLWAQLMAVSDEATIGQRLIVGAEMPTVPILDENGNEVGEKSIDLKKWRKDRIGWLTDPTAKAHEWKPAALEPFTKVIEIMVAHIAAQTRTPAHYLLIGGTLANISSDAMKALETGLVERTREKTQHFGRAARDVFELIALVLDEPAKAAAVSGGQVLWRDIENRSDAQVADAALKDSQIGIPLRYILERRYNLAPPEIDRVMEMRAEDDPLGQSLINQLDQGHVGRAAANGA